ncbi:hypothetical protein EXD76_07925 [BEV proteobacterium]|nr:hypothetical protein [Candidatus Symbiopectobacterium sp. Chty_BC]
MAKQHDSLSFNKATSNIKMWDCNNCTVPSQLASHPYGALSAINLGNFLPEIAQKSINAAGLY